ncbi:hypothetical protein CEP54_012542 [Fusarium duplospermum]|uniref:Uncharacterized protein n=1 Tax=Fusarium duplospermum TaxID=1325734 RepID=A0A428P816_9HYPO|nr:hypothetical protein CEP54_012542 [Fusarium duplospermum]
MISPIESTANSCDYDDEFVLRWTDDIPVEEIEEMFGVAKNKNKDNTSTRTKTKPNHIDYDETRSGMDNATGSEDGREAWLTAIDGKLQFFEPETGRIYPMETMPEKFKEFKQWLKDECRSLDKKYEWIRWIMDLPLGPSEFDGACMTPFNDLKGPEKLKAAVKRSVGDMCAMHTEMESSKKVRDEKLEEALEMDFNYRSAKKDVEWYTMVIKKSLENDGES